LEAKKPVPFEVLEEAVRFFHPLAMGKLYPDGAV